MVEKKLVRLRKGVIAEYRRLVTPFFYIRLKTREYKRYDYMSYFANLGVLGCVELPRKLRMQGWNDYKGNSVSKELRSTLDVINERVEDNVLRISA